MSDHSRSSLRHALKQVAVTGTAGSFLLGAAVVGVGVPQASSAIAAPSTVSGTTSTTTQAAPLTLHTEQVASRKRRVDVKKEMRTARAQKGKPYRYGAAGPNAFDCSGFTSYVLKKQGIKIPRTAAAQYRSAKKVSSRRAKVGDFVFFFSGGRVTHVGILAGRMKMWAAPHTGSTVRLQKIYGKSWRIGRIG